MSGQALRSLRRSIDDGHVWNRVRLVDAAILDVLRRLAPSLLRASLGVVFFWFGALKVLGMTPVTDLVAGTVFWADPRWFVPALGAMEVLIGLGLILGRSLRLVLVLFTAQMAGTFLVFLVQPDVAFMAGNPLLLTVEGEFVVKNLVLLSAGLSVGSRLADLPAGRAAPAAISAPSALGLSTRPLSVGSALSPAPTSAAASSIRTGPVTRPRPLSQVRAQALPPLNVSNAAPRGRPDDG